jgi:hypothetical protein
MRWSTTARDRTALDACFVRYQSRLPISLVPCSLICSFPLTASSPGHHWQMWPPTGALTPSSVFTPYAAVSGQVCLVNHRTSTGQQPVRLTAKEGSFGLHDSTATVQCFRGPPDEPRSMVCLWSPTCRWQAAPTGTGGMPTAMRLLR